MYIIYFIIIWLITGFILSRYFFTDTPPEEYEECPYE